MRLLQTQIAPTLDTSAYASGDQVSTLQELSALAGKDCELRNVVVLDAAQQKVALDLFFFDRSVTVASDNAAASITDADMKFCLGVVSVQASDYDDIGSVNSTATVAVNLVLQANGSIYVAIVSRGAPTYAASSLTLTFSVEV